MDRNMDKTGLSAIRKEIDTLDAQMRALLLARAHARLHVLGAAAARAPAIIMITPAIIMITMIMMIAAAAAWAQGAMAALARSDGLLLLGTSCQVCPFCPHTDTGSWSRCR